MSYLTRQQHFLFSQSGRDSLCKDRKIMFRQILAVIRWQSIVAIPRCLHKCIAVFQQELCLSAQASHVINQLLSFTVAKTSQHTM